MSVKLTWWGHGCWLIEVEGQRIVLDPFLDASPTAPLKAAEVAADWILVSHGHFDHIADAGSIANRTGAGVVANFEICQWLAKQGVTRTLPMNLGGIQRLPFGQVQMTLAFHSSQLPDDSYGGNPGGFLLTVAERRLYFACDTALFSDMQRLADRPVDLAVLPIGDLFTMGPDDALEAVKLLSPRAVAPSHYNTWPPIAQDAEAWAQQVRDASDAVVHVPAPGQSFTL